MSTPGAAIGKSQAAKGSHLARKVEESEAKSLALEPQDSVGHRGKGHQRVRAELSRPCGF